MADYGQTYLRDGGSFDRRGYVDLLDEDRKVKSATRRYRDGASWKSITDAAFPFEFGVPRKHGQSLRFTLSVNAVGGGTVTSPETVLGE